MDEQNLSNTQHGGIDISGDAHAGVGGDMVGGDKIVHGDEYSADGDVNVVTIGAGARVGQVAAGKHITQTHIQIDSPQNRNELFEAIRDKIDARPPDGNVDKDEIQDKVGKIETETAKGTQANVTKVERWLADLKMIAPDIFDLTAAALINPIAGVPVPIQKAAEQIRSA